MNVTLFLNIQCQGLQVKMRPRSIRTWTELQADFLKKFFPTHRTNGLKRQISNFSARENEKFYECWERYMEAINACPHHGFDTWLLVSYFLWWHVIFNEADIGDNVWGRFHEQEPWGGYRFPKLCLRGFPWMGWAQQQRNGEETSSANVKRGDVQSEWRHGDESQGSCHG